MPHIEELKQFLSNLMLDPRPESGDGIAQKTDDVHKSNGPWTVWLNPPWNDFTREFIEPGYIGKIRDSEVETSYPEGALAIRGDVNFWMIALLPIRFAEMPLADLVKTIWPHVKEPTLFPDHDSPYWQALINDDVEVPGEPYELWVNYWADGNDGLQERLMTFSCEEIALEKLRQASCTGQADNRDDGQATSLYVLKWTDGSRRHIG